MQQHNVVKEYLDIAFRRKWWLILPAVAGVLCAFGFYFKVPPKFRAETRVSIRPQSVSRHLLTPIIEQNPLDLVTQIQAEIRSEQYVREIEERLKLIGRPGGPPDLASLARALDRSVDVDPNPRNRYFELTVVWNEPEVARDIANEMAGIYMRRSKELRRGLAEETLAQLTVKRQEVEGRLKDVREQIRLFRAEHRFELETQQQANLQAIENARSEIERLNDDIRTWSAQIEQIDIDLRQPVVIAPGQARDDTRERLARLRQDRDTLIRSGLTPLHPRVRKLDADIAVLEEQVAATTPAAEGGTSTEDPARAQLEANKRRLEREIATAKERQGRLDAEIKQLQGRLERTPTAQIELDQLMQQEEALLADFNDARQKEGDASEGTDAEMSSQGERFDVLNPAIKPTKPFYPNLRLFLLMGLAVGGGAGIGIVLLLEVFDQSFKSEEQVAASIDLPLLAVIPDLTRLPAVNPRPPERKPRKAR